MNINPEILLAVLRKYEHRQGDMDLAKEMCADLNRLHNEKEKGELLVKNLNEIKERLETDLALFQAQCKHEVAERTPRPYARADIRHSCLICGKQL
jgi:hypothetical protein